MRLAILIATGYIRRNLPYVVISLGIVVILIFAQIKFNLIFPQNTIRIGMVGTYQQHDLPSDVTKLISKSLVYSDESWRIKPNLVLGWDTNNDATTFKFKLGEGIFWSDGTKVLAGDLELSIPGAEVTALDDATIQFKLKEPYSPLSSLLTKPIIKKGTLLGTGPYKVRKIEKSRIFITKITLEPQVWDLPKIYIRFYPNEKVAQTGFKRGEVEVLLGIADPNVFSDNPQAKLKQKLDFQKIVTIFYHTKDPLLSNRSVRQALSFQAPKISGEEIANNPYPKNLWAYDEEAKKYLSNPKEAAKAMERAKSAVDEESLKKELTLTTAPNLERIAQKLASAWRELGFEVKIRVESGIPQNFQALLITQSIPQDPDQYFLWHSTQERTNLTKYSSPRVDKDLEDGRKVISEEDRKAKYFDFQKTLLEDAPATFLYFPKHNIVYLKKVESQLNKVLSVNRQGN